MVSIPRYLSGFHLALAGVALLVWSGAAAGLCDPMFAGAAVVVALAFAILARPHFVLTPQGLRFVLKIFGMLPITHATIERKRIHSVTVAWGKEDDVVDGGEAAVACRVTYLGIFLEYTAGDAGRRRRFTLRRARSEDDALTLGRKYAAALACPLKQR